MLIKQKCQKRILGMTINRTTILKKQNLCRNVGTIVEGLKRCLSVGIRILTCIGADNVFVGQTC